jgi:hypothetical protein
VGSIVRSLLLLSWKGLRSEQVLGKQVAFVRRGSKASLLTAFGLHHAVMKDQFTITMELFLQSTPQDPKVYIISKHSRQHTNMFMVLVIIQSPNHKPASRSTTTATTAAATTATTAPVMERERDARIRAILARERANDNWALVVFLVWLAIVWIGGRWAHGF